MSNNIRLIATDLDGTLIGRASDLPFYNDFRERVKAYRERNKARWVVCTGRSLRSFRLFFNPMRAMGLTPDFIIVKHAYIYQVTPFGTVPHGVWNARIRARMWRNARRARRAIKDWHARISGGATGVTTVAKSRSNLCLRFDTEEAATAAMDLLLDESKAHRNLMVFKYMMEVDVRSVPFTKGMALKELARRLRLAPREILAVGNGHNDLSMFDPDVASETGCPSNSEDAVVHRVSEMGGHIAQDRSLKGVIEILDAFTTGEINSKLPGWMEFRERKYNPASQRPPKPHQKMSRQQKRNVWLSVGIVYAVIVVFAGFGLLPFSGFIMKPYAVVVNLFQKALQIFYSNHGVLF